MCCDKLATTQYFLKNNVLWQKKIRWQIHATIYLRPSQHVGLDLICDRYCVHCALSVKCKLQTCEVQIFLRIMPGVS